MHRGAGCVRLTEEQQERETEQDQYVADMRHLRSSQHCHLLLRGSHEEEAGCVQKENWQVLEAVDLIVVLAVRSDVERSLVAENEADLDEASVV